MRRVRASQFLRAVIFAASVLVFVAALLLFGLWPSVGTLAFLIALWVLGIEGDLLPFAIEWLLARRAARSGKPVTSIWFVDVDREKERERERFHDDTRDNPTIR